MWAAGQDGAPVPGAVQPPGTGARRTPRERASDGGGEVAARACTECHLPLRRGPRRRCRAHRAVRRALPCTGPARRAPARRRRRVRGGGAGGLHPGPRRLGAPAGPGKALAYLRQTVVNLARSTLRRRLVAIKHAPKPMPHAASAEEGAYALVERAAVVRALRELPRRQREAIVLRYYGDLTEADAAVVMGCGVGSVKAYTSRGLTALADKLTG